MFDIVSADAKAVYPSLGKDTDVKAVYPSLSKDTVTNALECAFEKDSNFNSKARKIIVELNKICLCNASIQFGDQL